MEKYDIDSLLINVDSLRHIVKFEFKKLRALGVSRFHEFFYKQ